MKKIVFSAICAAFLVACGENSSSNSSANSAQISGFGSADVADFKSLQEWLPKGESVDVYQYRSNDSNSPAAFSSVNSAKLNERQKKGQQIYSKWCLACHGEGMPATNALAVTYQGLETPALLEARSDLAPELVELFVRNGQYSMPLFRKTEINDEELKLLTEYLGVAYRFRQNSRKRD